jgi:DoxX-like protein
MSTKTLYKLLHYFIAAVWIASGLFCKVLNLVPRHELIVARILGNSHAILFTKLIGVAEVCMAIWILSRINPRLNALTQMIIIAVMNTLEFFLAPDLLLWGKANAVFASLFILLIFYNEFILNKKSVQPA